MLPAIPGAKRPPPFRKVADGERRVEGLLERMDCRGDRIVLDVRSAGRLEQFAAPAAGVEFISYRPDLAGGTARGARKPPDRTTSPSAATTALRVSSRSNSLK